MYGRFYKKGRKVVEGGYQKWKGGEGGGECLRFIWRRKTKERHWGCLKTKNGSYRESQERADAEVTETKRIRTGFET